jgi:hypothetical protein
MMGTIRQLGIVGPVAPDWSAELDIQHQSFKRLTDRLWKPCEALGSLLFNLNRPVHVIHDMTNNVIFKDFLGIRPNSALRLEGVL